MLRKIVNKALNILQYLKCMVFYCISAALAVFVRNNAYYKNLWLIAERTTDARDNGYHFFKYLRENHKNINCAYVIDSASPDYERVSTLGKTIEPKSFKHYLALVCSRVKISTHIMGYTPDAYRFAILDRKLGIVKGKKVFLQHGIISNDIQELRYGKTKLDLFICSTVREYELLSTYGYPDGVLRRLGLCRYDALACGHKAKKQILVMPTWRYYLRPLDEEEFKETEYYKNFNGLISDERLHKILEENDYELALYLHYELQKFSGLFSGNSGRIKIKNMQNADVQELLMESEMLITDYSSVFFDFAYMKKPVAYWTFDYELFYNEQYGKGYMNLKEDGLGPNLKDKDEVIDCIEHEIKNDMAIDGVYMERIENTFKGLPQKHCEQTYMAICELLEKDN